MAAFGIKAIQPQDNEHIFGFATARATADMSLLEVWNGPTNSDIKFTIDKEGQLQGANGSAARPTYSYEADKDSGRYMSGAGTFLDVVAGTAVGTWTAGKLTLVELQVDNLNINGNTLSSTAGTDLNITPLSGQQIVLDGTIVIDAGVVTGATSITSTAFVGTLTGASTATLVTVVDSTDTTSFIAMYDSATGDLAAKTDGGLLYNAGTGMLTATGLTGPLTGLASTATLASTVVVIDSTDTSSFIAMFDSATGSLAAKTDGGLTYNSGTGMLTATGFTGPLTGLASTSSLATEATNVTATANNSADETVYPTFVDGATSTQGIETDTGLTYNPSSGTLTSTVFVGALTGNASGSSGSCTGNSATATLASTVTVAASSGDTTSHIAMFDSVSGSLAVMTDPGLTYNATSNVLTAAGFAGPITGAVTGNADTATLAATVVVIDSTDTSSFIAMFDSATGSLAVKTDGALLYNAGTGRLDATLFYGPLTGNVTGNASGSSGSCTGTSAIATVANTVVVVDSTDASSYIAMFDSATGSLAVKTDGGITYNASTGMLTATGLTGPLTGLASTATLASTVVVVDSTDDSSYIAMFDSATGSLAAKTDTGLTYHAGNGILTATGFAGPLTGLASTATLAATVTVADESSDTTCFPAFFTAATGSLAAMTDTSRLTYNAGTGAFASTSFVGALTGALTGTVGAASASTGAFTSITAATTLTVTGTTQSDGDLTVGTGAGSSGSATAVIRSESVNGAKAGVKFGRAAALTKYGEIYWFATDDTLHITTDTGTDAIVITTAQAVSLSGALSVASTSTLTGSVGIGLSPGNQKVRVTHASAGEATMQLLHTEGSTPHGLQVDLSAFSGNRTQYIYQGRNSGGEVFNIWSSGGADFGDSIVLTGNENRPAGSVRYISSDGDAQDMSFNVPSAGNYFWRVNNTAAMTWDGSTLTNPGNLKLTGSSQIEWDSLGAAINVASDDLQFNASGNYDLVKVSNGTFEVAGNVGVGVAANANYALYVSPTWTTSGNAALMRFDSATTMAVDATFWGVNIQPKVTEAGSGTHPSMTSLYVETPYVTGAGAATTAAYGLDIVATTVGAATTTYPMRIYGVATMDPYIFFQCHTATNWSIGVDDSDSDKFKISNSNVLGTDAAITIDTSENVSFAGNLTMGATNAQLYIGATSGQINLIGARSFAIQSTALSKFKISDDTAGATRLELNLSGNWNFQAGNINTDGSVTKGSGSFRIDHPLPAKTDTHHLVHSFIEGPRADLIYRGVADLSGGSATVDLDEAAGITEGTWGLLCRDPQCWIQNDSGWSGVSGSIEGNTLTIECEEAGSSDTVSWMVVAERCDPHMYDTGWTDDDGRVIVEPEKEEEG